jgi:hypothetical protein
VELRKAAQKAAFFIFKREGPKIRRLPLKPVIPAKAGIFLFLAEEDSGFRRNDDWAEVASLLRIFALKILIARQTATPLSLQADKAA